MTQRGRIVEAPPPPPRPSIFAAFRYHDYRMLWIGLVVSNLGTWMQITTEGYMVVQLAGSARTAALDVGILGASSAVSVLLLSPLAGYVADAFPRRRVLLITNSLQVANATLLGVLVATHQIQMWQLFVMAGLRSGVQAFDAPARQSWVPLLVPREYVANAIGLNSIAFNGPSIIGPPVAGILITYVGLAMSYFLNAAFTSAVIVAVVVMKPVPPSSTRREGVLASIWAGVRFLAGHPVLRSVIGTLVVICLCVRPYVTLMPAYAAHVVHVDARGLGLLLASSGIGAIFGSLFTAQIGSQRGRAWFASALAMALGVLALSAIDRFVYAVPVLIVTGTGVLVFAGCSNVMLQTLSPDEMRGRAISVFSMVILGLIPAGALLLGSLASQIGIQESMRAGSLVALAVVILVWCTNPALRKS